MLDGWRPTFTHLSKHQEPQHTPTHSSWHLATHLSNHLFCACGLFCAGGYRPQPVRSPAHSHTYLLANCCRCFSLSAVFVRCRRVQATACRQSSTFLHILACYLLLVFLAFCCLCALQAGTGHSLSAVQHWSVWFMSLISAGIAVASVVVNDYFDLKLDATNAPDKPLPSGKSA